ncbi:MAG: helix-turn-helix transcriptional regulator [Acidimicrobiales bacterium]
MELDRSLNVLALLSDPVRRELYRHVRGEIDPVTRDQAAQAAGISRKLAAFHLDKLVEAGLLLAGFRSRPHHLGRPVKVYAPSEMELSVSIPERRYETLAELLVRADLESPERHEETIALARDNGEQVGKAVRAERRLGRPGPERTIAVARELLAARGFEPRADGEGGLWLANCPYKALADKEPELVCGINRAFIEGLVRGLGNGTVTASRARGGCCVRLSPPGRSGASGRALARG